MASFKYLNLNSRLHANRTRCTHPRRIGHAAAIAAAGSFAAAARAMGMVPSALTYRVRQIEDALDVLLYDRSARQAKLTEAGAELLREGARLLDDIDAVANRVKRVATGWEPQFTIALDSIISKATVMELCESFFALSPPTRIRCGTKPCPGTLEALTSGQADLAIGVTPEGPPTRIHSKPLGSMCLCVCGGTPPPAGHCAEPIERCPYPASTGPWRWPTRCSAAAGSRSACSAGRTCSRWQHAGQAGCPIARTGRRLFPELHGAALHRHRPAGGQADRAPARRCRVHYAWRGASPASQGRALQWWLKQLESQATRALLSRHWSSTV
jgi:DNA-binding transcriptional LysR family regulator